MSKNYTRRAIKKGIREGVKREIKGENGKKAEGRGWMRIVLSVSTSTAKLLNGQSGRTTAHVVIWIGGRWADGRGLGGRDRKRDSVAIQLWTSAYLRLGRFGSAGSRPRPLVIAPSTAMIGKPINLSDSRCVNFFCIQICVRLFIVYVWIYVYVLPNFIFCFHSVLWLKRYAGNWRKTDILNCSFSSYDPQEKMSFPELSLLIPV